MQADSRLPAKRAKQVQVNATVPSSLFTTAGNWTGEHGLSTNSPGASLNISPPNGTALLELTQDVPSAPGAPFDVSISPPPPMQPAQQSFVSSLYSHDMLFAIGILNVVLFRVELDPKVKYSVNVTYAGNGTDTMVLHNIGAYQSK